MSLILKNDILYLHIPKTGGNWLTSIAESQGLVVGSVGHKHSTFDHVLRSVRITYLSATRRLSKTPTVLCVVRNPLTWYESWFRYQTKRNWKTWGVNGHLTKWHVCSALNDLEHTDFMAFMKSVNASEPGFVTRMYGRYTQGSNATVLRNEHLAEDFVEFAARVKLPIDRTKVLSTGRIGESPKMDLHWDDAVLRETIENETAGFRAYGYALPETRD